MQVVGESGRSLTWSSMDRGRREYGIELVFCQNGFLKTLNEYHLVAELTGVALFSPTPALSLAGSWVGGV